VIVETQTIGTDRQAVARFDGDKEIVVYHDNSARDRDLSFRTVVNAAADDDPLSRSDRVQLVAHEVANTSFTDREFQNHTGRPDIIALEIISPDGSYEYLITEVKNSSRTKTIRQGIKETLEYVAFLRMDDEFVFTDETEGVFGDGWNGLLVVQDLEQETASFVDQAESELTILQAGEVDDKLQRVLEQII